MTTSKNESGAGEDPQMNQDALPAHPSVFLDDDGNFGVLIKFYALNADHQTEGREVLLSEDSIALILSVLATPSSPEMQQLISDLMRRNLRSLLRLTALGIGVDLVDSKKG